ncbi:MAG: hypothetical protein ABSC42_15695 [Tepidisphaeraceae bacterium]|jgi:hypothetical protein
MSHGGKDWVWRLIVAEAINAECRMPIAKCRMKEEATALLSFGIWQSAFGNIRQAHLPQTSVTPK